MFDLKTDPDAVLPQNVIKKFFSVQKAAFRNVCIDITSEKNKLYTTILSWILMTTIIIHCILMLVYAVECRNDIILVTDILAPFWQSFLSFIKMWCFQFNKQKIIKLVRYIWLWNLNTTDDEFQLVLEANKNERFYSLLFARYITAAAIMALISPVLISCFYYFKGYGFMDTLDLPLKAALHIVLDPKSSGGYIIAFIWTCIVVHAVASSTVGIDSLFSWYSYNVAAQFRIISLRFKTSARVLKLQGEESSFTTSIVSHVEYHKRVIELANYVNEVFMVVVLFKYTISFLQLAVLIFQISRVGELATMIFHIIFFMAITLQLLMYCRGGQMIIDESTYISMAIYKNFEWHKLNEKSKKLLLIVMMRAQKPSMLTGVFFELNLPLYLRVFKTAGSFYAMLRSLASH